MGEPICAKYGAHAQGAEQGSRARSGNHRLRPLARLPLERTRRWMSVVAIAHLAGARGRSRSDHPCPAPRGARSDKSVWAMCGLNRNRAPRHHHRRYLDDTGRSYPQPPQDFCRARHRLRGCACRPHPQAGARGKAQASMVGADAGGFERLRLRPLSLDGRVVRRDSAAARSLRADREDPQSTMILFPERGCPRRGDRGHRAGPRGSTKGPAGNHRQGLRETASPCAITA